MKPELLKLIRTNHDAYYVNRGFYYQYLTVLQKWIQHYISGSNTAVFTEVGNDIKEVGQKLVYTQIKCYKAPFSFQSSILKKELFTFFVQYLEEKETNPDLEFHFYTNTSLTKNETLLLAWMNSQPLAEGTLRIQCSKKIKEILKKELKSLCALKLNGKTKTDIEKHEIKAGFTQIIAQLDVKNILEDFVSTIQWFFGEETPAESITTIHNAVLEELKHEKFEGRPPEILLEALLSEICRCSQLEDSEKRKVDNNTMEVILARKDDQIINFIDESLIQLLNVRINTLEKKVAHVQETVHLHGSMLGEHELHLNSLLNYAAIPKEVTLVCDLTLIPYINNNNSLGRANDLLKLNSLLKENRCVSLAGVAGIGKSNLAKLYAHSYRSEYNHLLWIDAETGIYDNFVLNESLMRNLSISPEKTPRERFLDILQKLNNIKGKALLIIDDLTSDEKQTLDQLKSLHNWHIILTSRLRIDSIVSYEVRPLTFEQACQLYRRFEPNRKADHISFEQFFSLIEYNTLTIILVAKTIHLSFDLNLKTFLDYLKDQRLDDEEMEVDIEVGNTSVSLLNILQKTFSLKRLNSDERYYMEFFALLPAEGITMTDLVLWYGKEYEKKNKAEFTKVINLLHKKGLITRSESQVKMDRMFQESVLYQLRKDKNSFVSQMFHIPFLRARLHEGAEGNPEQAVHFVKYAQSFVKKIKEDYRGPIYQPMLLLENEMLNILGWLQNSKNLIQQWEDLTRRASAYLAPDDFQLGVIFHNFGLALVGIDRREEATEYFDKSIVIFKSGKSSSTHLLNMMCNKAHLYLQLDNIKGFKTTFQEITDLINLHNLWYDPTLPLQCHLLGTANKKYEDFATAKKFFGMAINAHNELPAENRNDLNLVVYLCDYSFCLLIDKEIELAEKAAITAVNILERLKVGRGKHLKGVVELMICITHFKGESENNRKLQETLQNLSD